MEKDFSKDAAAEEAAPAGSESGTDDTETRADLEEQALTCVDCGAEFVFSVEEQEFFRQRGLSSPPKRCKPCRAERRKARRSRGRRGRMREYRGPAFREKRKLDKIYRSPAFQGRTHDDGMYRSPAFREREGENVEEIYRGPAFQEQSTEEIYRGPGFQPVIEPEDEAEAPPPETGGDEYDLEQGPPPGYHEPKSPEEIYRSPAFSDTDPASYAPSYRRRQMHDIVCAECGRKARVPFKPRKDRPVYCKDCYGKKH